MPCLAAPRQALPRRALKNHKDKCYPPPLDKAHRPWYFVSMKPPKIRLNLELDPPSGVYTVTSPDVPGLVTEGSTPAEIQRNVREAIEGLMEVWADQGIEIPPALRPAAP